MCDEQKLTLGTMFVNVAKVYSMVSGSDPANCITVRQCYNNIAVVFGKWHLNSHLVLCGVKHLYISFIAILTIAYAYPVRSLSRINVSFCVVIIAKEKG